MRSVTSTSQTFQNDQQLEHVLTYWDSPFTALINNKASAGMLMEVREPGKDATGNVLWTLPALLRTGSDAAVTAEYTTPTTNSSRQVITNGRTSNVIGYWAGGAPGYHGATWYRRVAYRFRGTFRAAADRGWFSSTGAVSLQFGVAGSGYIRIRRKTPAGNPTTIYQKQLTEELFWTDGMKWANPTTFDPSDVLEIFYVQNDEPWGGFVVKVRDTANPNNYVSGDINGGYRKTKELRWSTQDAVVVGCGLFDEGVLTAQTLPMITSINVENRPGQSTKLTFTLPLITNVTDGVGWEHVRDSTDPLGHLLATVNGTDYTIRRNRLLQCKMGFRHWDPTPGGSELWTVFTGFIEDIDDTSTGMARVTASGFEQRLAEQFVKNYPDQLSYMCYGFRRKSGTVEPVYPIAAYDNWPMELAIRDLLVRCGVDESRMAAPLMVPQANGTDVVAAV